MAQMNRHLDDRIETVFLMPNEKYFFTSSSLIKQVHTLTNRKTDLVPDNVYNALLTGRYGMSVESFNFFHWVDCVFAILIYVFALTSYAQARPSK